MLYLHQYKTHSSLKALELKKNILQIISIKAEEKRSVYKTSLPKLIQDAFQLHILEALCIHSLRPSLCKQKNFAYQSRLFKYLY